MSSVKRELFKDFSVGLNMFDTFDSAPPNPDAARNDVGVTASIGWSFGRRTADAQEEEIEESEDAPSKR